MRRVAWIAAIAAIAASPAVSQSVEVYSGEHADFSRIAIVFPTETTWEDTREEDGYRIRFSPRSPELDLSALFDRMPRTRITSARQSAEDGSLILESACACRIEVTRAGERTLAIDVLDAPEVAPLRRPDAAARPEPSAVTLPVLTSVPAIPAPVATQVNEDDLALETDTPFAEKRAMPSEVPIGVPDPALTRLPDISSDAGATVQWRNALVAGLEAAAEAGLVELAPPAAADNQSNFTGPPAEEPRGASVLMENLDIRTAYEAFLEREQERHALEALPDCPPDMRLAFLEEAVPERGLPEIQAARQRLISPLGDPSPEGAFHLMQSYLALGMGAEAALVMPFSTMSSEEAAMFRSLARILDHGSDDAPETWRGLQRCEGRAALWALLGQPVDPPPRKLADEAAQRAFFALPPHLRLHLGSEVARRLKRVGAASAAAAIRLNVDLLRAPSPAASVAEEGRPGAPTGEAVSEGRAEQRVRELLERLQEDMESSRPIAVDDLQAAEAMSWEYEGTEAGLRFRGAAVLGRLERGNVSAATDLLAEGALDASDDPVWNSSLRKGIGTAITSTSDTELLTIVLHSQGKTLTDLLSPAQKLGTAARLTQLGFPAQARRLVPRPGEADEAEIQIALAAVSLAEGDPRQALALISGRRDPQAIEMRARAQYALGEFALAAEGFDAIRNGGEAAHAAWLSGQPEIISQFGTEDQQSAAGALRPRLEGVGAPDPRPVPGATQAQEVQSARDLPSLAGALRLADDSAETRAAIQALLSRP